MKSNSTIKMLVVAVMALLMSTVTFSQVDVTFKVDMTGVDMSSGDGVYIVGELNSWTHSAMALEGDNVYSVTLSLAEGAIHYYYYTINTLWEGDQLRETFPIPAPCGSDGTEKTDGWAGDRFVTVPATAEVLATVPYGGCSGTTPVNKVDLKNEVAIYAIGGGINVEVTDLSKVEIFSIDGKLVSKVIVEGNKTISCSKGVYIVKVNNAVKKVMVAK